jgi:DNA processing protein
MNPPRACAACLRRAWLLARLAPYVERVATGEAGSRSAELLRLGDDQLAQAVAPNDAERLLGEVGRIGEPGMRKQLAAAGCWACCEHDEAYPQALAVAADAPRALIGVGDWRLLARRLPEEAVAVVGARRASGYGREVARRLGYELTVAGLVVVSGMAFGIDTAAHTGAVDAGPAIAVLGNGPDVPYPAANRRLHRRLLEGGAVLSELPPGARPWRWTFPARNRIMAALAQITVVVEGAQRSGSLITADIAEQLGRDVGAVPGPVTSRASEGPNQLLAGGALVIRGAQDILDSLLGPGAIDIGRVGAPLEPQLAAALAALERAEGTCDAVATELGDRSDSVAVSLARLELLGYLECSPLGVYSRTPLRAPS